MQAPTHDRDHSSKSLDEARAVHIVNDDGLASIAPARHVPYCAGVFQPERPCHAGTVTRPKTAGGAACDTFRSVNFSI